MFCSHASSGRKLASCSNPAIMCTLYDFSRGLCLWKAAFSSSPALFPSLSSWPEQAAGLNYFKGAMVAFSGPACSWKQSSQSLLHFLKNKDSMIEIWPKLNICVYFSIPKLKGTSVNFKRLMSTVDRDENAAEEHHPSQIPPPRAATSAGHCWHCAATADCFLTGERSRRKVLKTWKFLSFLALSSVAIAGDDPVHLKSGSSCHIRYTTRQNKGSSLLNQPFNLKCCQQNTFSWEKLVIKLCVPVLNDVTSPW